MNNNASPETNKEPDRSRKPARQPVPGNDMAQIGLSLTLRLMQFSGGSGKPEHRLEQVFIGLAGAPATKELYGQLLATLNRSSDGQWRSAVTYFLACCADPANIRYAEIPHPAWSWRPVVEAADRFLRNHHIELDRLEYSLLLRPLVKRRLSLLSRESPTDTTWIRGTFTTEAPQTAGMMRRHLSSVYGEQALAWLDGTARYIEKKVLNAPAMRIALEIMDKQGDLAEPSLVTNVAYQEIEHWIRTYFGPNKGHTKIYFPGATELDDFGKPAWNEEARVGLATFHEALARRVRLDAAGIVDDFQNGLLMGYLHEAVKFGLLSELGRQTAEKRGGRVSVGNPSESPEDGSAELHFEEPIPPMEALPDLGRSVEDEVEVKFSFEAMMACLTPEQEKVMRLMFEKGQAPETVAKSLGCNLARVFTLRSKAIKRIKAKFDAAGVAKTLPKEPQP